MERKYNVHIFSLKPDICGLIKKTFSGIPKYNVTCSMMMGLKKLYEDEYHDFDCIVIDSDIDRELMESIKRKYSNLPMIYLPSLESESTDEYGERKISEPLKISELAVILDEILEQK